MIDANQETIEKELSDGRHFGFLFTLLFGFLSIWVAHKNYVEVAFSLGLISALILIMAILKPRFLLPLNASWIKFGNLLGAMVSPIVIGLIFLIFFVPLGVLFKITGRDELRLRVKKVPSHWQKRELVDNSSFDTQF